LGAEVFESILPHAFGVQPDVMSAASDSENPSAFAVEPSRRWQKPARRLARLLLHQRRVRDCTVTEALGRPAWTEIARLPFVHRLVQRETLLLFRVPLIDGFGTTIEERLVCLIVHATIADVFRNRDLMARAARIAARSVRVRLNRLARVRRIEATCRTAREQQIADTLTQRLRSQEIQPGLFDRRALTAAETQRTAADVIHEQLLSSIARWEQGCAIKAGSPALLLATGPAR
jgi:hypothetical protein